MAADNPFGTFFKEDEYIILKNYLYNYLLRKRAIGKCLQNELPELVLEIGSGISPVVMPSNRTVYSDLSFEAIQILKRIQRTGNYVVADGSRLPFKSNGFSHIISSEVLEHISNDLQTLNEAARLLKHPSGRLIITVPHRKCYFANDDDLVNHYRRYELREIEHLLKTSGLEPIQIQKVLGPLEKLTMMLVTYVYFLLQSRKSRHIANEMEQHFRFRAVFAKLFKWANVFYRGYIWLDAKIMPYSFSSVILVKSTISKEIY